MADHIQTTWTSISLEQPAAIAVDEKGECLWICQPNGDLRKIRFDAPHGTAPELLSSLDSNVVALAVNDNVLVAACGDGTILTIDPDDPVTATEFASGITPEPGQIALLSTSTPAIAIVPQVGEGLSVLNDQGQVARTLPVPALAGVVWHENNVYVATNTGLYQRGQISFLLGPTLQPRADGLPHVDRLGRSELNMLLALHSSIGCVSLVDLTDGSFLTFGPIGAGEVIVDAQGLEDGRVVVLTRTTITVFNSIEDLGRKPYVETPSPIFINSWTRVHFSVGNESLDLEGLKFLVPDGGEAGFVSYTTENGHGDPIPLLVVGGGVGAHKLNMISADDAVLASVEFTITDEWNNLNEGPPGFHIADYTIDRSDWALAGGEPMVLNQHPHSGIWNVMIVMMDTESARWDPRTVAADKLHIMQHVSVGQGANGASSKKYYEENSAFIPAIADDPGHGLTLSVVRNTVFGPVSLSGEWDGHFYLKNKQWQSKPTEMERVVNRGLRSGAFTTSDFENVNAVVVVPCSPDDAPSDHALFVWPHARFKQEYSVSLDIIFATKQVFSEVWVPLNFRNVDGREMHTALSHELGHSLDLHDSYIIGEVSSDVRERKVTD